MSVVELNFQDPATRAAVLGLQREAFGEFSEALLKHIVDESEQGFVGYGIFDSRELVAVNCFVAHPVSHCGVTGVAYQSCMSATRSDQKGKGSFSKIINFAKDDLYKKGGAFIFGFPNINSGPIFVKRLGFSISENRSSIFLASPIGLVGASNQNKLCRELTSDQLVTFDVRSTAAWKEGSEKGSFFEYERLTNYLFGRVVSVNKASIRYDMLVVGGIEVNKPYQFNTFLSDALKTSGCRIMRVVSNSAGPVSRSARITRGAKLTEPTIAFGLRWNVDAKDIETYGGLKDVY